MSAKLKIYVVVAVALVITAVVVAVWLLPPPNRWSSNGKDIRIPLVAVAIGFSALAATVGGFIVALLALTAASRAVEALTERSNLSIEGGDAVGFPHVGSSGTRIEIHNLGDQRIEITSLRAVTEILIEDTPSSRHGLAPAGALVVLDEPYEFVHQARLELPSSSPKFPAWNLSWERDDRRVFRLSDVIVLEPGGFIELPSFFLEATDPSEALDLATENDLTLRAEFIARTDRGSQHLVHIARIVVGQPPTGMAVDAILAARAAANDSEE